MGHEDLPSRIRRRADGGRQGHLLTLMGTEWDGYVYLSDIYVSAGAFLAVKHLNERSGAVLPDLPALMEGCDFRFTFEQRETEYNPHPAVRELVDATTDPNLLLASETSSVVPTVVEDDEGDQEERPAPIVEMIWEDENHALDSSKRALAEEEEEDDHDQADWQHPFAATGAAYSYVTTPLTIVASALDVPVLSGSATSTDLDDSPLFGRTIPTNSGDARAALLYYDSIGVTHVAVVYIADNFGVSYHADLQRERAQNFPHISLVSFPYTELEEEVALEQLKASGYRHVYAIVWNWKSILEPAYDLQVVGNEDYTWITAELVEWAQEGFALNRTDYEYDVDPNDVLEDVPAEYKWKHALNGIGQLSIHVPEHEPLQEALNELSTNETLRNQYIRSFHKPELWEPLEWTPPDHSLYTNMNYDAMIAMGLAACRTPGLFTGSELYETLRTLEFEGTTGQVKFHPATLNRDVDSVPYRVDNVWLSDERSDEETIRFESNRVALISEGHVQHFHPWRFYDNTTNRPLEIPALQSYDYNLVPTWAHVFGLGLAALVILCSLGWMGWTYWHRKSSVIKASQPIFLCQLCIGTFVMASAVVPMTFQGKEESLALDVACMSVPWLVVLGFVTALSALFSKAWRLNKLIGSGMQMRRIQVEAVDVIKPYVIFMTINIALLLGWTLVSPWKYIREESDFHVDSYGRSLESYGTCKSENQQLALVFQIPIGVVDVVGLMIGAYQSFKGRHLPTAFSESKYLAISMASLLESLLLGAPIMFVLLDDPTALFTVGAALICISCLTILIPVFLPKFWGQRNADWRTGSQMSAAVSSRRSPHAEFSGSIARNGGTSLDSQAEASVGEASSLANSSRSWGKMSIKRTGGVEGSSRSMRPQLSPGQQSISSARRLFGTAGNAPPRINRRLISSNASSISKQSEDSQWDARSVDSSARSGNSTPRGATAVRFAPDTK